MIKGLQVLMARIETVLCEAIRRNIYSEQNWKLFRKLQSSEILESRKLAILHNFVGQTIT